MKDIVTMKQNNINAIRTCHYPDAVGIYDLCDEYGLYMIAENNLESHGTWDSLRPAIRISPGGTLRSSGMAGYDAGPGKFHVPER